MDWTPRWSRRGFLWLGGMAVVGAGFGWPAAEPQMANVLTTPTWRVYPDLATPAWVTREVAMEYTTKLRYVSLGPILTPAEYYRTLNG